MGQNSIRMNKKHSFFNETINEFDTSLIMSI